MTHPDPRDDLDAVLTIARALDDMAAALGTPYLTAHLVLDGGLMALTCQDGSVVLTGHAFEVELTSLDAWPPAPPDWLA